jgi:hypothetical protein
MSSDIVSLLPQFLFVVPPLIAYVIGLIFALHRKRRHPFASALAMWGFVLPIVETVLFSCIRSFIVFDPTNTGFSISNYGLLFSIIGFFQVICFTAGIGLVIGAIFSDRGRHPATPRRNEPGDFDAPPRPRPHAAPPTDQPETFRERRDS